MFSKEKRIVSSGNEIVCGREPFAVAWSSCRQQYNPDIKEVSLMESRLRFLEKLNKLGRPGGEHCTTFHTTDSGFAYKHIRTEKHMHTSMLSREYFESQNYVPSVIHAVPASSCMTLCMSVYEYYSYSLQLLSLQTHGGLFVFLLSDQKPTGLPNF